MERLADCGLPTCRPEVASPVNTSAFLVTYLVRLPTTGLDRFAEPRPSAEPNWKNNFRVGRHTPGAFGGGSCRSPHAYWRSKSPGLPTQAGLCLEGIRAA
jgi:hypothetical protein